MWAELDNIIGDLKSGSSKTYKRQWAPSINWGPLVKSFPSNTDHSAHYNSKRELSPEPETWEEWGTNVGNHYANQYGTPDQVPGLPRPGLNSKREQDNHGSPNSVPGDRNPGNDEHHGHHHCHGNSKHDPSETTTPTSASPHVPSPTS